MKEIIYIGNAFSISMLESSYHNVEFTKYNSEQIKEYIQFSLMDNPEIEIISAIGHVDTCNIVNNLLETNLQVNRASIKLGKNSSLIVAQYSGPRLPEGATKLPFGSEIKFWIVNTISF